jgi:valyl-tRNA synthetase
MENFDFSEAWQELQIFTKNEFCDYYIEEFKITKETSKYWVQVITYVLDKLLRLWHPYIPFVTEEIYSKIWFKWDLITWKWWKVILPRDEKIEKEKILVIDIIREIRNLRAINNILPNKKIWVIIFAKNNNVEIIKEASDIIIWIVKSESFELVSKKPTNDNLAYWIIKSWVEVYIDTSSALNVESEIERLKEQIIDTQEYIALLDKKLLNESFVNKAPEKLVRAEMEKKELAKNKLCKLEEKFKKFK